MRTLVDLQADTIRELMSNGATLEEALRASFEQALRRKVQIKTWTYQGDMICPVCRRYSKTSTTGRGQLMTLKLTCHSHGLFVKTIGDRVWTRES